MQTTEPAPSGRERDEHYMRLALAAAEQGAAEGEVPVGAVLVGPSGRDNANVVLACSHNAPIGQHDPTAHAEMRVLREAARKLGNYRLEGCELFVTLEPCAMCAQAILHARLRRVVFGAPEPRTGAAGSVLNLFGFSQLNHQTKVEGGVLADACGSVLRSFFEQRRSDAKRTAQPLREDALRTPDSAFEDAWKAWADLRHASRWQSGVPGFEGLRLHYLDVGDEQAEAWVALHGPEAWWPQWADWARAQAGQARRALVPDLIGFGQSDKPKKSAWHQLETHASGLAAWLRDAGIAIVHVVAAPGQERLAMLLQQALGGAAIIESLSAQPVPPRVLEKALRDLPYPDAGHRAGPRAWASNRWDVGLGGEERGTRQ
jgi:tRNA(adenine34) deaminase